MLCSTIVNFTLRRPPPFDLIDADAMAPPAPLSPLADKEALSQAIEAFVVPTRARRKRVATKDC